MGRREGKKLRCKHGCCVTTSVISYLCLLYILVFFYLQSSGLHFRHTDNTVQWLRAMESVGLPKVGGGVHRKGDA